MATSDLTRSEGGCEKMISQMYSLPINATPERDAALEMRMIQLIANAMDG